LSSQSVSWSQRREIFSWASYDFANSPYTTLVVTFILLSPILGAVADRGGYRKIFLMVTTGVCIVGTMVLYTVLPGQTTRALIWFVIANIAYEMGMVFYNAFLPDIAPRELIGRVSGWGWALGYAGGLLALVVALVAFVRPEVPWFGFSTENGENVRATNLLVAVWFAVFSLPTFLWVKEDKSRITTSGSILDASFKQFATTFKEIREYKQIFRFLIARLVYNDGLVTIFAFGGIYAAGTFGFTLQEIMIFGIVLNVAAGLGAFGLGFLDDRLGGKRTIQISLWGLSIASLIAVLAPYKWMFWLAGIMVGIFAGPTQSASRSLMGRFVPPDKENEFFGFFAFSGKATAFMGPLMLGLLTELFDTQRAGVSIVLVLFVLGFLLLQTVDEEEGIRAAARSG
jgi:UMF1 family MFS transporter